MKIGNVLFDVNKSEGMQKKGQIAKRDDYFCFKIILFEINANFVFCQFKNKTLKTNLND